VLDKYLEILHQCKLFEDVQPQDIKAMLECLHPRMASFKKGEIAARNGEPMEGLGILLEGNLAVQKENSDGTRIILHIVLPGEMFGEIALFTEEMRWPATIAVLEDSVILFIPGDKIVGQCFQACSFHRRVTANMLKIVSEKALTLNRKVQYLSIKGMREKLCTFFWELYKKNGKAMFRLPMNRNELADFLNVSRPSMSREMCRMRDEGMIDFHLSTIKILDKDKLAAFVQ
jgi:CRP-like cAMP-binding protein